MLIRQVSHPRSVRFKVALRYMNRFRGVFMSAAKGGGWQLYRYYGQQQLENPVGDTRKWSFVAFVENPPQTTANRKKYGFWGNFWANPSKLT